MSTGTSGEYWAAPELPSVFKHALLSRYLPKFGGMTGSGGREVVYLDGYAGKGRYEDGTPGSAERVLMIAADHQAKNLVRWTCFFSEKHAPSYSRLEAVAAEYRARGVDARAFHGDVVGLVEQVLAAAVGRPLFLFLDPCGLALPFDRLAHALSHERRAARPATELLLNFSMVAVRRIGGNSHSPKGLERSNERLDEVLGGRWWRDYFVDGYSRDADEAVAREYSKRLAEATGMHTVSVPVSKAPQQKSVYNLVFCTRSNHGLWVFGDAIARARDDWWKTLEVRELAEDDALFPASALQRPDPEVIHDRAVPAIAANLTTLLQVRGRPFKLVDETMNVFGNYYGQVHDTVAREALKQLHREGGTPSDGKGPRIYDLQVEPPLTR